MTPYVLLSGCIYVSGVCVYNYVSGAGIYIMFLVWYICCWCGGMYVFDVRLLYYLFDFKILYLSCYFAKKKFGGPFSGQPDIPEDCQISQLGSPADCQIFRSYFYP